MSRVALAMNFQHSIGIVEKWDEASKGARDRVYLWCRSENDFIGQWHFCNEQALVGFVSPWSQV